MSFSAEYRDHVEDCLSKVLPIRSKAMFGGVGIYADDVIFAIIAEDKLYLKVDDLNQADYEAAGMEPFYPFESPQPMGYWELPGGVLEDARELKVWADKAVAVAERAKTKRKPRKTARAR